MTKRDYILIAQVLKNEQGQAQLDDRVVSLRDIAYGLGIALEQENPAFRRGQFLTACGV